MFEGLTRVIREAFSPHAPLFQDKGDDIYFDKTKSWTLDQLCSSLLVLSKKLHANYEKLVVILIDEYDAPIQTAYLNGYYDEMVILMRNLFEDGLKDNDNLYKGVLTGVTRVAKANLFSGLNHFKSYDIDARDYAQYFGFTEDEVKTICPKEHMQTVKDWYNGYKFGKMTIYNPWSILQFVSNSAIAANTPKINRALLCQFEPHAL